MWGSSLHELYQEGWKMCVTRSKMWASRLHEHYQEGWKMQNTLSKIEEGNMVEEE
jgi:hypothetical protein